MLNVKTAEHVLSVTQLSKNIRSLVESGLPSVWVEGEISNYKLHSSGHRYFTLKDRGAQIPCVMWRTRNSAGFDFKNGLSIRGYGKVTVWEQGGRYQMDVQAVLPLGVGSLQAQYEALKEKLASEGIFDLDRKRQIPRFPRAIGIVTSPTGAAIKDFVWGFQHLYPPAQLFLIPVAVQGVGSADQIATAIETFNKLKNVDVIVIGRGGGSLEDLWAFNEEVLVRVVVASRIPIVSAVGHEVDISLCDLAADLRAPTPTGVAPLIVPDKRNLSRNLTDRKLRMARLVARRIELWRERLKSMSAGYGFQNLWGRVNAKRLQLDEYDSQIRRSLGRNLQAKSRSFQALSQHFSSLSPKSVMKRGYSIVRNDNGDIVKSSRELEKNQRISITLFKGDALAEVTEVSDGQ